MSPELVALLQRSPAVPSAPEVVRHLVKIANDPDYKQADLVRVVSADAGIAADILRLANSALLGGQHRIATLSDAIVRLGIRRIRTLVISRCMIHGVSAASRGQIDPSYFFRRSLATAALAARIAERSTGVDRDAAFVGGLLCDVGVMILSGAMPQRYRPAAECYAPLHADDLVSREREILQTTHPEISAWLLDRWMLPSLVVEAVRHHHDLTPHVASEPVAHLAGILNGSSEVARALCEAPNRTQIRGMCVWAMEHARLDLEQLVPILRTVESDIAELATTLQVEIISSRIYGIIADAIAEQLAPSPA
ncbi:MAG: hypothetical protein CHACPFDD_01303 [Phycisphaerae bacterium]|nr:hypothetical protein [Phycisphaerae bacterium]